MRRGAELTINVIRSCVASRPLVSVAHYRLVCCPFSLNGAGAVTEVLRLSARCSVAVRCVCVWVLWATKKHLGDIFTNDYADEHVFFIMPHIQTLF